MIQKLDEEAAASFDSAVIDEVAVKIEQDAGTESKINDENQALDSYSQDCSDDEQSKEEILPENIEKPEKNHNEKLNSCDK